MDVILGRGGGTQGCIAVELRIPDRKHGVVKSEFGGKGEGGEKKGRWVYPTHRMLMGGKRNDSIVTGCLPQHASRHSTGTRVHGDKGFNASTR